MNQQVNETVRKNVFQLLDEPDTELQLGYFSQRQQAQILELAQEVREFKKQDVDTRLLSARSRVKPGQQALFVFDQLSAEQGHATARWHLAYGEENRQPFIEFGIRPVFHDLLDNADGFVKGAAISVLDTRLRWFDEQRELQLETLNLFNLMSLSPVEKWMTPLSARLDISVQQQNINPDDVYIMQLDAGMGLSARLKHSIVYVLADVAVEYSGYYEKSHKTYLGTETGAVIPLVSGRALLSVQSLNGVAGENDKRDTYQAGYQFDFTKDRALRLNYKLVQYEAYENRSLDLKYLIYF